MAGVDDEFVVAVAAGQTGIPLSNCWDCYNATSVGKVKPIKKINRIQMSWNIFV